MRILTLITTFAFLMTLAGCAHQEDHVCGPTCCAACCEHFSGGDPVVREGMTAEQWAARAEGADAWTRQEIIVNLAAMGPSTLCYAERWMNDDEDPALRFSGAELARMLGSACAAASTSLRALTSDASGEVRTAAVRALGTMSKDDLAAAVPDLERALDDEEWDVRYHAARAIAGAGYHAESAMDRIEYRWRHDLDARVRRAARAAHEAIEKDWSEEEKRRRLGRR